MLAATPAKTENYTVQAPTAISTRAGVAEGALIIDALGILELPTPVTNGKIYRGVADNGPWATQDLSGTSGGHTYNIAGFDLTKNGGTASSLNIIAIATNDTTGIHNILGNVSITAATTATDNSILTGFAYQSNTAFGNTGKIDFGTNNLTVIQTGAGDAFGFAFVNAADGKAIGYDGQTTVGTITVQGESGAATGAKARGWYSGAVTDTGVIDIANIDIFAGTSAIGVFVEGDFEGALQVGTITVKGEEGNEHDTNSGIQVMGDWNSSIQSSVGSIVASANTQNIVHGVVIVGDDPPSGITGKFSGKLEIGSILAKNTGTLTNALYPAAAYGWASGTIETGAELKIDRITALSDTVAVGFGVSDRITNGKITLGDIVAAGANYNGTNDAAAGMAVGFTSTGGIETGKINIDTITVRGTQKAAGIGIGDLLESKGAEVTSGKITVKGMDVTTTNGDAQGWYSGAVGIAAVLDLGTINVTATGGGAVGIYVDDDFKGTLSSAKITAIGGARTNGAPPATTAGIVVTGTLLTDTGSSIGEIHASATGTAANENVYGIAVSGADSEFTISNDITAKNAGSGIAQGIHLPETTGTTVITVAGNLEIIAEGGAGSGGIVAASNLTLEMQGNHTLTADSVSLNGANSSLYVKGPGTANLGVVNMGSSGALIIGNGFADQTIVSVDGARMIQGDLSLGQVKIDKTGILEIYGDTIDFVKVIGTLSSASDPLQIVSTAVFTKWGADSTKGIRALGVNNRVKANDNYLAAAMIHQNRTGWHAVRDHMISGAVQSTPRSGYYGQQMCDCPYGCLPLIGCGKAKPRGGWVNYIGRTSQYESSFNGNKWNFTSNGVQIGTDFCQTQNFQFGAFFGYEDSTGANSAGANLRDRLTAQDYYVGLYAVKVFQGGTDLRTVFNFGFQDYTSRRNSRNGQLYRTAFRGNTAEVNVELGRRYYFPDRYGVVSLRPAIGLDWYLNKLDGGVEASMSNPADNSEAIRYGKADVSQLFLRFGTDFRFEKGRGAFEMGVAYSYDLRGSDLWSSASSAAIPELRSTLVSSKLGRSVFSLNLGGSYLVGSNFTVFGGYRGEAIPDRAGRGYEHLGYVGGAWRW